MTEIERTLESLTAFAERQQAKSYGGDFYAGVAYGLEHAAAEIRRAIDFDDRQQAAVAAMTGGWIPAPSARPSMIGALIESRAADALKPGKTYEWYALVKECGAKVTTPTRKFTVK